VLEAVRRHALTVRYILLTHAHFDHVTGVARAKQELGAPVGLHRDDDFLYRAVVQQGMAFGMPVEPQPPIDFFYDNAGPWRFGRYGVWVSHTPGHSPGGVCLAVGKESEESRTLFVGDTLFAGSIGRTDLPGGDTATLLRSIREVLFRFRDETPVYAGHGEPTTIGRERATNPFLNSAWSS
jgi:glyoxylase-like metal-dependent hydrolase (beta-lactamase superfamily II)